MGLPPKGLILYQRSWADRQNLEEDMLQMAEAGYSVVAIDPNAKGADWGRVGLWAEKDPLLPVYLIAADDYDEDAVVMAVKSIRSRLRSVQLEWLDRWKEDKPPLAVQTVADKKIRARIIPASKEDATKGLVAKGRWALRDIVANPWKEAPTVDASRQVALKECLDYIEPPKPVPAVKKEKR